MEEEEVMHVSIRHTAASSSATRLFLTSFGLWFVAACIRLSRHILAQTQVFTSVSPKYHPFKNCSMIQCDSQFHKYLA